MTPREPARSTQSRVPSALQLFTRPKLERHQPHLIEAFSGAIRDQVADFRQLFFNMFNRFRACEAGAAVAGVVRECFRLWCERSYIVPPDSLHRQVEGAFFAEDASAEKIARLLHDLGFPREVSASVSESLYAERKKKQSSPERRLELLWPSYEHAIWNYSTETAHVYAARLLLYRIGEDQGIFEERISGQVLESILAPATDSTVVIPRSEPLSRVAHTSRRLLSGRMRHSVMSHGTRGCCHSDPSAGEVADMPKNGTSAPPAMKEDCSHA